MKTPRTLRSKFEKLVLRESPKSGVTSLFTKQMNTIVTMMKMLKMKEANELNLNALKLLARETGKTITKLNIAAQKIYPYFVYPITSGKESGSN